MLIHPRAKYRIGEGLDSFYDRIIQSEWGDVTFGAVLRALALGSVIYIFFLRCRKVSNGDWWFGITIGLSGMISPDGIWLADVGRSVGINEDRVSPSRRRLVYDLCQKYLSERVLESGVGFHFNKPAEVRSKLELHYGCRHPCR